MVEPNNCYRAETVRKPGRYIGAARFACYSLALIVSERLRIMNYLLPLVVGAAAVLSGLSGLALAQDSGDKGGRTHTQAEALQAERAQRGEAPDPRDRVKRAEPRKRVEPIERARLDQRHSHNHYYPPRGHVAPALPSGALSVHYRSGQYFFHSGVWFRPSGARFIVSLPPIGIVVPILPPTYTTLWVSGAPYYYANGVYYATTPGQGYVVVEPPAGVEIAQPVPQAPDAGNLPEQVIYPRNGQSADQMEADRQDCNRWAMTQPRAQSNASVFQRAIAACMEGRGYTVR